ncbi:HNH endonuclease [Haloferula sp. A504]|uniref:HNH endonuclease n=1 Tax=Haloferula sp. A504 TaxID=3373601 RepID=UPI0031BD18F6|nr:HNH endonuclease [Verrucomicrobiaceae bacterium E54]
MSASEAIEAAYSAGLQVFDGEIRKKEALESLSRAALAPSSASSLVWIVGKMLKGEKYTRALNIRDTDSYLTWIRRDKGDAGLRLALEALRKHIAYYEKVRGTTRTGLREVLEKHKKFLGAAGAGGILLEYLDRESRGFVDLLPLEWFAEEGTTRGLVHEVRGCKGGVFQAKCDVTVTGDRADLDYTRYPRFNRAQGMWLGIARIEFGDLDRTSVAGLSWQGEGEKDFQKVPFRTGGFEVPPVGSYQPPTGRGKKVIREVREREGQGKFRRSLRAIYDNRCCITGCRVVQVLESAHIDPYQSEESNHVANGLLLRADLHTLFDNHLIAVKPGTLVVYLAKELREDPSYAELHGKRLELPKEPSHHPDRGALERRWCEFCSAGLSN